ncbi:18868_t:CDS:2, partial [Gigaspora rosea]
HEETEETLSDKFSDNDHDDTENVTLSSEENIIERTESSSIISYISSNEKPGKTRDENLDNYQPSYRPLSDILDLLEEASIESDSDSIYNHRNDEHSESDTIEVDNVLEDMTSDFEGFESEYGPYFPNFTSAMFFIWITKHMISTLAYEDLVKILKHPEYQKKDVTTNIRQIRKWRYRLPLAQIHKHNMPLCMKRTPSTYESTKMWEFWHSELWQDSLLFGEHEIENNEGFYRAGDFLTYYNQSSIFICRVRDLHNICPTDNHHIRGNGKEL